MVPKGLRAFLYARNSRDAGRAHRSTDDQLTEGRRDCHRNEWVVVREFVDVGLSASRHARKRRGDFEEMAGGIRNGECDVVVAWESSRLQRDLEVYVLLRNLCAEAGVLWSLNGRVYDMSNRQDRFVTGLEALQAEHEAEAIRDRVLRTMRRSAERGWPHARPSYGFRREYDPASGHLLGQVPDEATAPVVREIVRRIASGESTSRIATDLTARGVPTRHGAKAWTYGVVRDVALNPANIGMRTHNGVTLPAVWDAIVDETEYWAAVAVLRDPGRRKVHEGAVKHLLSGIARCGVDGCGLGLEPAGPRHSSGQYRCRAGHNTIARYLLNDYVEEAALQWLERTDVASLLSAGRNEESVRGALAEAARHEATLAEARATVGLPGGLSVISLAALENNLEPLIAQARNLASKSMLPSQVIDMMGPDARRKWADADDVLLRRAVLRHIVVPTVYPGGRGVRAIRPGRVALTWPLTDAPDAS